MYNGRCKRGSLKDYFLNVKKPTQRWHEKFVGTAQATAQSVILVRRYQDEEEFDPIDARRVAKIGRQILEGLLYLKVCSEETHHLKGGLHALSSVLARLWDVPTVTCRPKTSLSRKERAGTVLLVCLGSLLR